MYLNGYSLNLNGGSSGNGLTVYGGTDTGDVSGNPTLTVNSTGTGTWNFYGGNQNGGNLAGNPTIVINTERTKYIKWGRQYWDSDWGILHWLSMILVAELLQFMGRLWDQRNQHSECYW